MCFTITAPAPGRSQRLAFRRARPTTCGCTGSGYFSARPGREEYYDWAVVRYWKIFYQFWCQSDAAGNLPEVRPKFMAHKKHLDAILPDILASKYLPLGEKLRAAAFCASPTLTYGAAAAWGRLHTRKGK